MYYLIQLDRNQFDLYMKHVCRENNKTYPLLLSDILASTLKYNISLLEYFHFRFFDKAETERSEWAGTGFMYEYQRIMNPARTRSVLENKALFLKTYHSFINRKWATMEMVLNDPSLLNGLLKNSSGKIVLKNSFGQCGKNILVLDTDHIKEDDIIQLMKQNKLDIIEEYVSQHYDLQKLSPSGLNTIRIITQIYNGEVILLAARLRITVNSHVDNLAAGNLAAAIDLKTGIVNSYGVYSDITKPVEVIHPVTKQQIIGFKVPYWREVIKTVKAAALKNKENKSIGWDVAVTDVGVEIVEANHNWCKLLWQLPVNKGLKNELMTYL